MLQYKISCDFLKELIFYLFSICFNQPTDGSLSDTTTDRKKCGTVDQERSPKGGSGMGKKSNSTSQLSATGMSILLPFLYVVRLQFSFSCLVDNYQIIRLIR